MEVVPRPNQPTNLRSLLIKIAFGLIAMFGAWYVFHILTTGVLSVNVSEPGSNIVISSTYSDKVGKVVKRSKDDLHTRLSPGQYIVDVTNGDKRSSSIVTIVARQTTEKTILLVMSNDTETVANVQARSLATNNTSVIYLDGISQTINTIGLDNKISSPGESNTLATSQWVNRDYGIGIDPYNQFYEVVDNDLQPAMGEVSIPKGKNVNYSIAPNKQIYYSVDKDVYKYLPGQEPQKIYAADGDVQIEAGNDGVLIGVFSEEQGASFSGKLVRVNNNGAVSSIETQPYDVISWSPSGKYIVLAGASQSSIYNKSLTKIASIPASQTISSPTWANDNSLLYATGDQIWEYRLKTQDAIRIAQTGDGGAIASLKTSDDGTYVYAIVDGSAKKSGVWSITRTSLNGSKFSATAKQLQNLLPISNTEYNIDYVNFTKPTIYIELAQFGDPATYKQAAIDYLKSNGVDTSKVTFGN